MRQWRRLTSSRRHWLFVSPSCLFFVLAGSALSLTNPAAPSLALFRVNQPCLLQMDSLGEAAQSQNGHPEPRSSHLRTDLRGLYQLGRTLGRGHFAVVKLARQVNTGDLVAVKMIDKTKLDVMATSHLLQEVR